ncbi:response regulator [Patescibacteria group bacterium]|nr:response regulator [Patescibacteria group bacterium]
MGNSQNKILLIEDDQFLREFYQELLVKEGYVVDAASDGEQALIKLQSNEYNLALLDIMLPKKDGVQILKDLKVTPAKSSNITIVVLSNLGQDALIKECLDLGAEGYLIKSALDPDQVLSEVKSYLQQN